MTLARRTSVIIPAFNEEHAVGPIVTGLQGAAEWLELLVVDDGSSDGTAARAAEAGARVICHPSNKGNGAAVKTGIRYAAGEFVLSAVIFLIGLVSERISSLKFEGRKS